MNIWDRFKRLLSPNSSPLESIIGAIIKGARSRIKMWKSSNLFRIQEPEKEGCMISYSEIRRQMQKSNICSLNIFKSALRCNNLLEGTIIGEKHLSLRSE